MFFFKLHDLQNDQLQSKSSKNEIRKSFATFLKLGFYCATIAYHVGLNANSGGRRTPANDQEKWTFGFGRVRGLVCTIAVSFGSLSFFSRWPPYWKAFEINSQYFTVFS